MSVKDVALTRRSLAGFSLDTISLKDAFLSDPTAKFILDTCGHVLTMNTRARAVVQSGIVAVRTNKRLDLQSLAHNVNARNIIKDIGSGRRATARILLRQLDETWIVVRYVASNNSGERVILVEMEMDDNDSTGGLDALAHTFRLTLTEMQVVEQIALAHCPKDIAREMEISINTVRSHLRSIYAKMGTGGYNSALQLILRLI